MTPAAAVAAPDRSKALHIALWIVQALLFFLFAMVGFTKAAMPLPEVIKNMPWAADVPAALVRFIGVSEALGALGLVMPSLTRIRPVLTPLAGVGLATIMALAIPFHVMRGEASVIGMHIVLGSLAAFVAWGRLKKAPIAPRT